MTLKRMISAFLAASLSVSLAACSNKAEEQQPQPQEAPAEASSGITYTSGTYTAKARGNNGDLTVEVSVSLDRIESVTVIEHGETAGIADTPVERIPQEIVEGQTLAVDVVSGATNTSNAILQAAEDCLAQAGADVALLKIPAQKETAPGVLMQMSADVVVIGGGGAGLASAVAAAEQGATVILLEKTSLLGGNTVLAGGGYNAYDPERNTAHTMTEAQRETAGDMLLYYARNDFHDELMDLLEEQLEEYDESGRTDLFDSPELHALQTYVGGDFEGDIQLIYAFTQRAAESLSYLESLGLEWKDMTTNYVGALWPRSHEAKEYKSGVGFIEVFKNAIQDNSYPVEILMDTAAKGLTVEDGKVVGVSAAGTDGTPYEIRAEKGVVLATGGFGANVDMRVAYNTLWDVVDESIPTTNSSAITGDGIILAQEIGAELVGMEFIQLLPTGSILGKSGGYVGETAGLYINKEGERFVNELSRRDTLVKAAMRQEDSQFYILCSEEHAGLDENGNNKFNENINDLIANNEVFRGDTVEDLAEELGIDPETLRDTVTTWNEMCLTQTDEDYERNAFAENVTLYTGPYYASLRTPNVHHTMGGVRVNVEMQVLDTEGDAIPGLYAAGEVTGGIHGTNRLGANAVPDAIANGRAAGQNASK